MNVTRIPATTRIKAPPIRLPICANAIKFMRSDAANTATFPVPPIELLANPAVIAASTGYNPNNFPSVALIKEIATILTKHKTTNCHDKAVLLC